MSLLDRLFSRKTPESEDSESMVRLRQVIDNERRFLEEIKNGPFLINPYTGEITVCPYYK